MLNKYKAKVEELQSKNDPEALKKATERITELDTRIVNIKREIVDVID